MEAVPSAPQAPAHAPQNSAAAPLRLLSLPHRTAPPWQPCSKCNGKRTGCSASSGQLLSLWAAAFACRPPLHPSKVKVSSTHTAYTAIAIKKDRRVGKASYDGRPANELTTYSGGAQKAGGRCINGCMHISGIRNTSDIVGHHDAVHRNCQQGVHNKRQAPIPHQNDHKGQQHRRKYKNNAVQE